MKDLLGKEISETDIQNQIIACLKPYARVWNITTGVFKSGNRYIRTFPTGTPDLLGFRKKDGKMFFIEVKNAKGRLSEEQKDFARYIKRFPVLYGTARSVEEAFEILEIPFNF
ncbi:MAG: VRR-NUC domain-containing protein [Peptoniphilus sp.]|uniref:VRR-NUC domain-containing protein n=1 Tax=Peptoniphilus sp. TaxID=1971214 RepID=UPI002A75BA06|nr:VRR-NUC domain-containing protein [Peptoniphilus sp.]MDY2986120.1 VRR-NUC domain-containing protein [Peptoniphilus sp.]